MLVKASCLKILMNCISMNETICMDRKVIPKGALKLYRNSRYTKKEISKLCDVYKDLKPRVEEYVFNDGMSKQLVCIDGTIPIKVRDSVVNISIRILLQETHPDEAPFVNVVPTSWTRINEGPFVDQIGNVHSKYLRCWKSDHKLVELLNELVRDFSNCPPIVPKMSRPHMVHAPVPNVPNSPVPNSPVPNPPEKNVSNLLAAVNKCLVPALIMPLPSLPTYENCSTPGNFVKKISLPEFEKEMSPPPVPPRVPKSASFTSFGSWGERMIKPPPPPPSLSTPPSRHSSLLQDCPEHWSPFDSSHSYKRIVLDTTDPEYETVAKNVEEMGGANWSTCINEICRIENRRLWRQYMVDKLEMEEVNGIGSENERILWHGTSRDALKDIYRDGFNRSFCGKNGTVHGNGVYFASRFEYSARLTYSPWDENGLKYVFQCRVLTGKFTNGSQELKDAPMRDSEHRYDSVVDDVANPTVFVIFRDMKVYPEYIISMSV